MYEAFFGLARRPFAAAPDPASFVLVPAAAAAFDRIERCVRDGAGVAVLTAVAGAGKTQLCLRLEQALRDGFAVAYLPNAGFPSRRGLLQAALYELGRPQLRLGEAELRQELFTLAREQEQGVVLILDEAHRYSERILDEVRAVANLVEGGKPVVRVVLAGQLELEEKLADPQLDGLNERIGVQVSLPRLTAAESHAYLRDRTTATGGRIETLFAADALELLVRACGGLPRCLNQLADHSLLLGFVAERRPVDIGLVQEALDDLRRLPLQWSAPSVGSGGSSSVAAAEDDRPKADQAADPAELSGGSSVEVGADFEGAAEFEDGESLEFGVLQADAETFAGTTRPAPLPADLRKPVPSPHTDASSVVPVDEPVADRFARLDAASLTRRWLEEQERGAAAEAPRPSPSPADRTPRLAFTVDPLAILDRIEPLVARELAEVESTPRPATPDRNPVRVRAPEPAGMTALATVAKDGEIARAAFATLFRDLRRRQSEGC